MTFAIAAAGTGGHVYPGLAVGEALVDAGINRDNIVYIGGGRLEADVFPSAGFPFVQVEMRGFARRSIIANLGLPAMVWRAVRTVRREFAERRVSVVLGFGNYITIPVALAARRSGLPFFIHEQNALPGMANRVVSRLATRSFVAFPNTPDLARPHMTGNPIRGPLADFDRDALRAEAMAYYGLDEGTLTVGVFGGSLGAAAINAQIVRLASGWDGPPVQIVHIAGAAHAESIGSAAAATTLKWNVVGYEQRMDLFFAASDLVIARAGGSVAELLATSTPSVVVPGGFGSGGHQHANAEALVAAGAGVMVEEAELDVLPGVVRTLADDPSRLAEMAQQAGELARPNAAADIAAKLVEASRG